MLSRIGAFALSSTICLIAESLLSLPVNSNEEPQVPRLTLEIPILGQDLRSIFASDSARKLCASAEGRATGRPYGFNKVRYIKADYGIEILGCITNNSTRSIMAAPWNFSLESTITSPIPPPFPLQGRISPEGKLLSDLVTLGPLIPPGEARFFSGLIFPDYTNTVTTIIKEASPPGQSRIYVPVQQLNITILR